MAASAILKKNRKIAISWPHFDRFWQNLTDWWRSTLLIVPTVNNLKFRKLKIARAAILKNPKSRYLDSGLTDRHEIWHGDAIRHLRCVSQLELCNFKNPISQPQSQRFQRNLAGWRRSALVTVWSVTNLKFKEINDGGSPHSEKK